MMASDLPASKLRRIGPLWAEACRRQAVIVRRLFKDRAGAFQETGDFDTLLTAVEEDFSIPFPSIETCIDEQIAAIVAVGHIWGGTVIDSIRALSVALQEASDAPSNSTTAGQASSLPVNQSLAQSSPPDVVDIFDLLRARWTKPVPVQDITALRQHLASPLRDEEKIPISRSIFNALVSPSTHLETSLSPEQAAKLFRISESEVASRISMMICGALFAPTPAATGTVSSFHSTWDLNIGWLYLTVLTGTFIRDSNKQTNIALRRPDYGLLLNGLCLLRGEEKGTDSKGDPEEELTQKPVNFRQYGALEYILGYHAVGLAVHFVAITKPPVHTEALFSHDLTRRTERLDNFIHMVRMCGVLKWMSTQLAIPIVPEFRMMIRNDLTELKFGTQTIKKTFKGKSKYEAGEHVMHLVAIYDALGSKGVPNVDSLVGNSSSGNDYPYIITTPIGYDNRPSSGVELYDATFSVLQALKIMHSDPPIYHRDIRGANIVKRTDNIKSWFLIDWSDATCAVPTQAITHLSPTTHSPKVRQDGHGPEVDIWGVGQFLVDNAGTNGIPNVAEVLGLGRKWMNDATITAEMALIEIQAKQHLFFILREHNSEGL